MDIRQAVSFSSSPAKRTTSGIAGRYQSHVNSYQRPNSIHNTPICNKCGKPMKIDWSDSVSGNKKVWYCDVCFRYRIVKSSLPRVKMLHMALSYPRK
jgi:formamidopyrimidine-DNA glycosylase